MARVCDFRHRAFLCTTLLALLVSACGATTAFHAPRARKSRAASAPTRTPPASRRHAATTTRSSPVALVTDETQNRLLVVALPSGQVLKRISMPPDPEYVATCCNLGTVVVTSPAADAVTLLNATSENPASVRVRKVLRGFDDPEIAAISPDAEYAYITEGAPGRLATIEFTNAKVLAQVPVGAGAHHLAFSPSERHVWVALGESARTIAILTTIIGAPPSPPLSPVGDPGHPRVIGHFDPGFLAHDLSFSPDGRRVWITSASGPDVSVFNSQNHRLLFRVPVGPPPQHLVFAGRYAFVTSGYGSAIEQVDAATGNVIRQVEAPYGSFELDAGRGYVVASSLLRGTLAIYNLQLKLLRVVKLAPSARDVAIW